jgi:CheY-like chemotaxis protein
LHKGHINAQNHNSKTSILAVDDEYDIVNLIKQSLERDGQHRVCAFIDVLEALNHFKLDSKDHHDIVISDIRMPGMNGYEFVKHVKNIDSKVKVMLMSAFEIQEENNEIVIVNPFYETTDSVRRALSEKYNHHVNAISKYEKEESLMIADSLKEYLGDQPLLYVKKGLANYSKMGKKGLSILADLGAYPHKSRYKELVDYESSLPTKYQVPMKGFCLYHQKDFDRFSGEQKQKLIDSHGKALKIIEAL